MQYTVVLVEDSPSDIELIQLAITRAGLEVRWHVLNDGASAMQYINELGQPEAPPCPDLFIVDWNLPCVTGVEILGAVRTTSKSAGVPVILASAAIPPSDVQAMQAHGANRVFLKPMDLAGFLEIGNLVRELLEGHGNGNRP